MADGYDESEDWERQAQELLSGLTILAAHEGTEEEAIADLRRQLADRGATVDDAEALRIVRETRAQQP